MIMSMMLRGRIKLSKFLFCILPQQMKVDPAAAGLKPDTSQTPSNPEGNPGVVCHHDFNLHAAHYMFKWFILLL